jgi:hypothetical protein
MSSAETASILPREAAITAALAGAVVVLLAYASGFGLQTPLVAAPVVPAPSTSVAVATPTAAPVPVVQPLPAIQAISEPSAPTPTPRPPLVTRPSTPAPTPAAPTPVSCSPGTLSGLLAPVDALVDGLLGADLSGTTAAVGCTVDSLLGSTCCDPAVAAKEVAR